MLGKITTVGKYKIADYIYWFISSLLINADIDELYEKGTCKVSISSASYPYNHQAIKVITRALTMVGLPTKQPTFSFNGADKECYHYEFEFKIKKEKNDFDDLPF